MTDAARTLSRSLYAALRQVRHYGLGHPAAEEAIRALRDAVRGALSEAPEVRLDASPDWLIVQGILLPGDDRRGLPLRDHLVDRGVARLILTAAAGESDLRVAVRLLALEPEELLADGGVVEVLRGAGTSGIEIAGPEQAPALPAETDEYLAALTAFSALFAAVERGDRLEVGRVQVVVESLDTSGGDPRPLWTQVALRGHDELDPPHPVNVAFLAMQLASGLGLDRAERVDIGAAGFLHDIGMARLSWEHRLAERTQAVSEVLPRHAIEGGRLLRHLEGRGTLPMLVAMEHHRAVVEGPAAVTAAAQIVALADYVEGMTCGRVAGVRPAAVGSLITTLLEGKGPPFDPVHIRVLAAVLAKAAASGADLVSGT